MSINKGKIVVGSMAASLLLAGAVSAGTTWHSFDGIVPGLDGSWTIPDYQTKTTTGALAGLQLNSSNGNDLDVRTVSSGGDGGWERGVKGGNTYTIDSPQAAKQSVSLEFSSDIVDLRNTPITGNWRSN